MAIKRRGAVLSVAALMLCVAVYLNWSYGREATDEFAVADGIDTAKTLGEAKYVDNTGIVAVEETGETSPDDYFAAARLSRQQARDEAIRILRETTENDKATEEAKNEATSAITELAADAVREARIENLVMAKGYEECVAFINDGGISVIVPATEGGLTAEDAAKIKDIAAGETQLGAGEIKIVEAS